MAKTAPQLIVGISGASSTIYGVRILEMLRKAEIETHLIMSKSAEMTLAYETDFNPKDVRALASVHYSINDVSAAISSGSFPTMGMIVALCSIRTMSEIATGVTATLLSRRRCRPERKTPARSRHPRDAAACWPPAQHDAACRNRSRRRADRSGLLQSSANGRRHRQSHLRPALGFVRHRHRACQTLEGWSGAGVTCRF